MHYRPEMLENAPLQYAPENELGVVFLFAKFVKNWQLRIAEIRSRFPDCIAYQKVGGREKKIRIEFEFRSSNFRNHKHSASQCDWIVCWEHDWPAVPPHLKVVELKRHFGLGFKVWIKPARRDQWHWLDADKASCIRRNMQGNLQVTEYWPYLFNMILDRNPQSKRRLLRFSPEKV